VKNKILFQAKYYYRVVAREIERAKILVFPAFYGLILSGRDFQRMIFIFENITRLRIL
jgi:hypothetical protein